MYCGGEVVEALGALAGRKKAAELEKEEQKKESTANKTAKQKADLGAIRAKLEAKAEPTKAEKIKLVVLVRRCLGMGGEDLSALKASMTVAHAQLHNTEFTKLMVDFGGSFPWAAFGVSAAAASVAAGAAGGCGAGGDGAGGEEDVEGGGGPMAKASRKRCRRAEESDEDESEEESSDEEEPFGEEEEGAADGDSEESCEDNDGILVGRRVEKVFDGKHYRGTVGTQDEDGLYLVEYDDGDSEEMDADDIYEVLVDEKAEGGGSETGDRSEEAATMEDDE